MQIRNKIEDIKDIQRSTEMEHQNEEKKRAPKEHMEEGCRGKVNTEQNQMEVRISDDQWSSMLQRLKLTKLTDSIAIPLAFIVNNNP